MLTRPQGDTALREQDVDHSLKFLTPMCSHGDHVHLLVLLSDQHLISTSSTLAIPGVSVSRPSRANPCQFSCKECFLFQHKDTCAVERLFYAFLVIHFWNLALCNQNIACSVRLTNWLPWEHIAVVYLMPHMLGKQTSLVPSRFH